MALSFPFITRRSKVSKNDLQESGVSPQGVARAIACYLVRSYGADLASSLADVIVGSVQAHARRQLDCPGCRLPEASDDL